MKAKDTVSADFKIEDYTWEGVFDEKLGTFSESSGEMKNISVSETINDPNQGKTDVVASLKSMKGVATTLQTTNARSRSA